MTKKRVIQEERPRIWKWGMDFQSMHQFYQTVATLPVAKCPKVSLTWPNRCVRNRSHTTWKLRPNWWTSTPRAKLSTNEMWQNISGPVPKALSRQAKTSIPKWWKNFQMLLASKHPKATLEVRSSPPLITYHLKTNTTLWRCQLGRNWKKNQNGVGIIMSNLKNEINKLGWMFKWRLILNL